MSKRGYLPKIVTDVGTCVCVCVCVTLLIRRKNAIFFREPCGPIERRVRLPGERRVPNGQAAHARGCRYEFRAARDAGAPWPCKDARASPRTAASLPSVLRNFDS